MEIINNQTIISIHDIYFLKPKFFKQNNKNERLWICENGTVVFTDNKNLLHRKNKPAMIIKPLKLCMFLFYEEGKLIDFDVKIKDNSFFKKNKNHSFSRMTYFLKEKSVFILNNKITKILMEEGKIYFSGNSNIHYLDLKRNEVAYHN